MKEGAGNNAFLLEKSRQNPFWDLEMIAPAPPRLAFRVGIRKDRAMNVENILRRKGTELATIAPEKSVKRAADWLRAKNVGALVVTSNGAILGIISERDIVRAFSEYGEPVASMQVKDIMTQGLITASLEDDLTHLMHLMTRHRVRHMPVLHNGKLAGIVSIGDVVKCRLNDLELEANVLRDAYIAHH
jgi:CBS domain-containing protein